MRNALLCFAVSILVLLPIGCADEASPLATDKEGSAGLRPIELRTPDSSGNCIPREPMLLYNVSGQMIMGPYHRQLSVYSDGCVGFSVAIEAGWFADVEWLDPALTDQLLSQLLDAGASLCRDDCSADVQGPMTTVTMFLEDRSTNTFSYYAPTGNFATIDGIIDAFIESHFEMP